MPYIAYCQNCLVAIGGPRPLVGIARAYAREHSEFNEHDVEVVDYESKALIETVAPADWGLFGE
jgi:hypothetical protein